jgi:hypothetical protein
MADSDPVTKKDLEELKVALTQSITESITESMTELIRDVETSLLTSFHGYGKGQAGRMTALEVGDRSCQAAFGCVRAASPKPGNSTSPIRNDVI